MGLLSNKIERQELKPGDHIYSWRRAFIYAHHGIYIGEGKVIHFAEKDAGHQQNNNNRCSSLPPKTLDEPCPHCGEASRLNGVMLSCIDCFLAGCQLNLFEYGVSRAYFLAKLRGGTCTLATSDPPEDVLHRAKVLLENGFGEYDVSRNNCEDFAIYCKTGLLTPSVRAGQSGQAASLAAATSVIFSHLARFTSSTSTSLTAVGSGVYYCYSRLANDIGVRQDVAKVAVESLVARPGVGPIWD